MFKKIFITLFVVIVVAGAVYFFTQSQRDSVEYITHTVSNDTLVQTVDATGNIESVERIALNFKISGQIKKIAVPVGGRVVAGQELSRLDAQALESNIADALAKVSQAEAEYEKLRAGASVSDIKIAQDTIEQKKQERETAERNLTALHSRRDTELTNLKETAITVMHNEAATAQGALVEIDNTLNDDDAQSSLSIKDSSALIRAQNSEAKANSALDATKTALSLLDTAADDDVILTALDDTKKTLTLVATALSYTLDTLRATVTSQVLSETELDSLKTNIIAQQTKISASLSNVQSSRTNWTNTIVSYHDRITSNENAIQEALKALQIAESQYEHKVSPPRQFEIDAAQAALEQARAQVALARANLSEAIIHAPIGGTIVKVNYEVGEQVSMSTPVFEMIGESILQIEVDIPESDIAKITLSQQAYITLDAFSDEEVFNGTVVFVDPAETIIQDVVYYKVKVQLDTHDARLKPGMTANVTILTSTKEDVLVIPSRAINVRGDEKYVELLINSLPQERIITTGLRGDTGVEVLSGLEEGNKVITFIKE